MNPIPAHLLDDALVAFREAVALAGGQQRLGSLIGKTQGAISKRLTAGKLIWEGSALTVEDELGVSKHRLRPDIYPIENTESPATRVGDPRPATFGDLPGRGPGAHPLEGVRT